MNDTNDPTPDTLPTGSVFEENMRSLEEIVGNLESGDLPLEQALSAFEQGVRLVRQLTATLSAAESRVEVLTRGARGELDPASFSGSEGE